MIHDLQKETSKTTPPQQGLAYLNSRTSFTLPFQLLCLCLTWESFKTLQYFFSTFVPIPIMRTSILTFVPCQHLMGIMSWCFNFYNLWETYSCQRKGMSHFFALCSSNRWSPPWSIGQAKFLLICPNSITDVTEQAKNSLHIALKKDQLKAFKFLVEWLLRNWFKNASLNEYPVLNWKDGEDNTLLHIVVSKNQI